MTAILEASKISVNFGSVQALLDVDLEVPPGKLVGLIGPNGAGKTTFIDAVTGFVPASGRVLLDGRDISAEPPHVRTQLGLARTWQTIELFDDLTVQENCIVASRRPTSVGTLAQIVLGRRQVTRAAVEEAIRILELAEFAERMPSELPQGKRKLVGVARALAGQSKLIMLDEPASGLDTQESFDLGRRLRRVVDEGVAMLLVDHDMALVLNVCDYVYVIDFGCVLAQGVPAELRTNDKVLAAYLGGVATVSESALPGADGANPAQAGQTGRASQ
ncbi:MAG: ABC transporter ATP-binding protein [Streptosporangiaceae bacterium]